jgi:hypothetical protein
MREILATKAAIRAKRKDSLYRSGRSMAEDEEPGGAGGEARGPPVDVGELSQCRQHQAHGARLRADARGGDGGVR